MDTEYCRLYKNMNETLHFHKSFKISSVHIVLPSKYTFSQSTTSLFVFLKSENLNFILALGSTG
jgi:hypothetical protein